MGGAAWTCNIACDCNIICDRDGDGTLSMEEAAIARARRSETSRLRGPEGKMAARPAAESQTSPPETADVLVDLHEIDEVYQAIEDVSHLLTEKLV